MESESKNKQREDEPRRVIILKPHEAPFLEKNLGAPGKYQLLSSPPSLGGPVSKGLSSRQRRHGRCAHLQPNPRPLSRKWFWLYMSSISIYCTRAAQTLAYRYFLSPQFQLGSAQARGDVQFSVWEVAAAKAGCF